MIQTTNNSLHCLLIICPLCCHSWPNTIRRALLTIFWALCVRHYSSFITCASSCVPQGTLWSLGSFTVPGDGASWLCSWLLIDAWLLNLRLWTVWHWGLIVSFTTYPTSRCICEFCVTVTNTWINKQKVQGISWLMLLKPVDGWLVFVVWGMWQDGGNGESKATHLKARNKRDTKGKRRKSTASSRAHPNDMETSSYHE